MLFDLLISCKLFTFAKRFEYGKRDRFILLQPFRLLAFPCGRQFPRRCRWGKYVPALRAVLCCGIIQRRAEPARLRQIFPAAWP